MRKLHRLLMAALVLVPLAACDEGDNDPIVVDEPAVGTVSGTVSVEGQGLAGVTVQLAGSTSQSTTTGSNGAYSFASVVEGNYSVTLSSIPGDVVFSNTTQSVSIATDGQTATADFNGQFVRTASILVTVTRADGSGVVTNVRLQGNSVDQTLGTNAQGNVTFSGLRSGDYTVSLPNPPAEGFDDTPTSQNVTVNTGQAVQVNFVGDTEIVPPEVSIERITSAATTLPVDPDSIVGRVDVTVQVEDNGNDLQTVELWVLQKSTGTIWKIAEQRFASVAPEMQDGSNDDTEVTFSWNSDAFRRKDGSHPSLKVLNTSTDMFDAIGADAMRPFHPIFVNGDYEIHGRVTVAEFEEGFNAIVDVTLENRDAINLGVVADNTDWNNPTTGEPFPNFIIQNSTGLRWLSGDIYVTVFPIIYSQVFDPNNPLLQRGNLAFDAFRFGSDLGIGGAELTTPNADGTFTFTFCEAGGTTSTAGSACYASINDVNTGLIGARNIIIQTKTAFGQFGPGFNAAAGVNNIKNIEFFNEDLQSGTGVLNDVLRIDNESPVPGSVNSYIDHPANAFIGVNGFSKTGLGTWNDATDVYLGWLKWDDPIDDRIQASPDDHPFVYPATDKNGNAPTGGVWVGYDANAAFAPGADLFGIGNPAGNPNLSYIAGPDVSASIAGGGASVASVVTASSFSTVDAVVGADLPPETDSPGLTDAGSADGTPFSDTETDYAMAGRHWDQFGNWINTSNYILFGVDGREPIFSDAAGTTDPDNSLTLVDPTVAGTVYNTYDDEFYDLDLRGGADYVTFGNAVWNSTTAGAAPFNVGKAKGAYEGYTTDRGNGFSGVAGVVVEDWERRCATGSLACTPFSTTTTRWGFTLQPVVPGGSAIVLGFVFDGQGDVTPAGADTFSDVSETGRVAVHTVGTPFRAYVATMDVAGTHDGYRDHNMRSYDRAGNVRQDVAPSEGIADHDAPNVGNVQMPTVVTFNLNNPYSFFGENLDNADLKMSDFSFDFNSILSLQLYASPSALSHPNFVVGSQVPPADVDGVPFEENTLQLPLENVAHTAFGSQDIFLGGNLAITTEFIGCLVRADEYGLASVTSASTAVLADADIIGGEPRVHRPRGPRWRTWDHSSSYGLVNTQFNTFVQTSIPTCLAPATIATNFVPALGTVGPGADGIALNGDDGSGPDGIFGNQDDDSSWIFNLDSSGRPRITFKGQTATFVPNIDPNTDVNMYYLDTAGRARLLDNSNFSLRVSDLGTGAFGRWYEYTLINPIPGDLIDPADIPADNGTFGKNGWFFVVKGSAVNGNDGHGVIWDETSNPAGVAAADALPTDGTVTATPGGNQGRFQFTTTANTGYLIQGVGATDLALRVNPIMNALTVADGEDLGQSEQEFVAYVANGMAATTVSTGATWVGEVNAQICTVSSLAVGGSTQLTLAAAPADCVVQPGQGGTLAGGSQIEAQMVQVTLTAGANYSFTVSTDAGVGDVADPGVILVAPDGQYVTRAWNNTANNNPETINFSVPAGAGGTYLLLVHGSIAGGDVGDIRVAVAQN